MTFNTKCKHTTHQLKKCECCRLNYFSPKEWLSPHQNELLVLSYGDYLRNLKSIHGNSKEWRNYTKMVRDLD